MQATKQKRPRRMSLRRALAEALLVRQMEQAEQLLGIEVPDEWSPFAGLPPGGGEGESEEEAEEAQEDESAEEEAQQQAEAQQEAPAPLPTFEEPPMYFSHFAYSEGNKRVWRRSFGSVRDYCTQPFACEENEALWRKEEYAGGKYRDWRTEHLRAGHKFDDAAKKTLEWYGAESGEEAAARALEGWPEGAERVRSMMDEVEAPAPLSLRRKVQRADQGDELDIHSVYRGNLDRAWSRRRRLHSRSRMSVRLIAQVGGSQHMTQDEMFWRGAAVAKLAELLEESSYRVEVVGMQSEMLDWFDGTKDQRVSSSFVVKDAASPVDLEQIAGVLCNAGFFRTHCFRASYATAGEPQRDTVHRKEMEYRRVLGKLTQVPTGRVERHTLMARSSVSPDAEMTAMLKSDGTQSFVVPLGISEREAAVRWVNKCLAALDNGGEQDE